MSGRKNNLKTFNTIANGDLSLASITSPVTCIRFLDNIGVQANFSGAPVGVLAIQVSADHNEDELGNVIVAGQWATIASSSMTGGSPIYFDLNQLSAPYLRLVYTKTSGSGTLNAFITAKVL